MIFVCFLMGQLAIWQISFATVTFESPMCNATIDRCKWLLQNAKCLLLLLSSILTYLKWCCTLKFRRLFLYSLNCFFLWFFVDFFFKKTLNFLGNLFVVVSFTNEIENLFVSKSYWEIRHWKPDAIKVRSNHIQLFCIVFTCFCLLCSIHVYFSDNQKIWLENEQKNCCFFVLFVKNR